MPYISSEAKAELDFNYRCARYPKNPGELNFMITEIIRDYYDNNGRRYQQINDVVGALEGAKLEFYRRLAAPYEDGKIKENGDVY